MGNLITGTPYSKVTAALEALDHRGIQPEHFARLRSDPDYADRVVESMLHDGAQRSPALASIVTSLFFANEEKESNYGYPQEYAVKPIGLQVEILKQAFQDHLGIKLDARETLAYARDLPNLSSFVPETWMGRDIRQWMNWYVVPLPEKIADTENQAVEKVLGLIAKSRTFHNWCKGALGPEHLRLSELTEVALQMIREKHGSTGSPQGSGDFLLIPAQFGLTHRGRSVQRVHVVYAPNEFGLGSFIVGCMILSHPERLVCWEQLHIDCPGDEYRPRAGGRFDRAPFFVSDSGEVYFSTSVVNRASGLHGSATGFVWQ